MRYIRIKFEARINWKHLLFVFQIAVLVEPKSASVLAFERTVDTNWCRTELLKGHRVL